MVMAITALPKMPPTLLLFFSGANNSLDTCCSKVGIVNFCLSKIVGLY